ncbi:maleylpyruvate isomerase N-terminal domain-containing protein [Kineosporia sp. R_H_3]|uniref:maleylpyruvate isomerase N-terminal domain-containing protein n=1 Tax=Kineosporia sp. R_H_3 TaxID=1961848 RepID=UPI000B4B53EF|nr:maleylpyruvate isomerase N-terminal domain-containing protein [Kineosporia sp. R_H_3]
MTTQHPGTAGPLSPLRTLYLATAGVAVDLLERHEVARHWDEPSILDRMTVGDLAAHLGRSVLLVAAFLDADPPPTGPTIGAEAYFGAFTGLDDLDSDMNTGIRSRAHEDASPGPAGVAARARTCLDSLPARFGAEPADRLVAAYGGQVMLLDEFLRTRLVELCVHAEDLELSVGLGPGVDAADDVADPPDDALSEAVAVLVGAARHRHGDAAVLRALARRERDAVDALRSF